MKEINLNPEPVEGLNKVITRGEIHRSLGEGVWNSGDMNTKIINPELVEGLNNLSYSRSPKLHSEP